MIAREFEVKELREIKYFFAMEVARKNKSISIFQRKYTLDLLEKIGMLGCKLSKTPIEFGNKEKMFEGDLVDKGSY